MLRWCIFYANRTTFAYNDLGADVDPLTAIARAPWLGVIAIVQDNRRPCELLHQVDSYWWRPDWHCWTGGDDFGFQQAAAMYGAQWLKKGETIRPEANREILHDAGELKRLWDAES